LQDQACGLGRGFDHYDDRVPNNPQDFSRPAEQVTQNAVSWIQQRPGPYVAFVHYFDAHFPYTPRAEYAAKYATGYSGTLTGSDADLRPFRDGGKTPTAEDVAHIHSLYAAEITQLDAALGPLLDAVDLNNTIVVITADHGESFGHDYWFNHREGLWDQVLRVPLIIAGPGFESGVRLRDQVGLIDLAPTVLAAAGLPTDAGMMGRDFRALGQSDDVTSITDPWREKSSMAVRTATLKVLITPTEQLGYDLVQDPNELAPFVVANVDEQLQTYSQVLKRYAPRQASAPAAPPPLDPRRVEQLETLGYIAPE
jgi:arylsulfatase A-like enzyme